MAFNIFGFEFGKKIKKQDENEENEKVISFVEPDLDGAHVLEHYGTAAGFQANVTVDIEGSLKTQAEHIKKYREMAMHPEADWAIDEIVNEAITTSVDEFPVNINLEYTELSENVKEKIRDEFKYVLRLLNYKRKAYEMFKDFYIDARLYYHKIVDEKNPKEGLKELRRIDSLSIKKVTEIEKEKDHNTNAEIVKKVKNWFVYNKTFSNKKNHRYQQSIKIHPDAIAYIHSGIYNIDKTMVFGHLHKAIKPLNQLRMIEDAAVIYRISRAPERRVFYVDTGRLPKHKAEQVVQDVMNRHRNKIQYNATTGELTDGKKHMHMLEDFFMPRQADGKGTEIQNLEGGQNLGEMDDVVYFQKKFYKSLNVPISRLEPDAGFALGRVAEITRDEVKFTKFVDRILKKFSELFDELLGTQLVLKGIMRRDEWEDIRETVFYDFQKDSYFQELKEAEIMRERVNLLRDMDEYVGKYFSKLDIQRNILQQTEEEIGEIEKQIEKENKSGKLNTEEEKNSF